MEKTMFPRTTVGGVSLSRMIIGTNWMLGYSHRTTSASDDIKRRFSSTDSFCRMLEVFLEHGVDTIMAPFGSAPMLVEAIRWTGGETGKKLIMVDTPNMNVDDTAEGRKAAREVIKKSRENGATFCLIHHAAAEQLVNKNKKQIVRLDDYTDMIRQEGLIPGLSAHMPELIVYSDANGYDVETYIQIYNSQGFLMQVEVESVAKIINNAKKPVMTIKPMAAGRVTPYVGMNFVWNTIRPCDMMTVGCTNPGEAAEDIEISLAAIERRFPAMGERSSPVPNQDVFGNKK